MNNNSKRFCLILNDAFSMVQFRGGLIKALVRNGFAVTVVVPPAGRFRVLLEGLGAEVIEIQMKRFIAPLDDLVFCVRIAKLFISRRFEVVHTMTLKPNLYAAPVARIFSTPCVVGLVSGSGYLFSTSGRAEHPLLARLVTAALRLSFRATRRVWFQNPDDRDAFVREKIIPRNKCVVIRGGGIDVDEFNPSFCTIELKERKRAELGMPNDCCIVLMVAARRIAAKGVREFAQAAAQVLPSHPLWRFLLIAPDDPGTPDNIPADDGIFNVDGLVAPAGFRDDIRDLVAASDIVTLPSYYQEGLPRFLLEGLACGKPMVTTDHTGCRETVLPGKNGFLIPAMDHGALADALTRLMDDEQLRLSLGRGSRSLCEREFSETKVCCRILKEVYAV